MGDLHFEPFLLTSIGGLWVVGGGWLVVGGGWWWWVVVVVGGVGGCGVSQSPFGTDKGYRNSATWETCILNHSYSHPLWWVVDGGWWVAGGWWWVVVVGGGGGGGVGGCGVSQSPFGTDKGFELGWGWA